MRIFFVLVVTVMPSFLWAQIGTGFHQSNLPFVALNYEIKNRWRPELRIGTDNYFDQTTVEAVLTYDLADKEDYEIYAGVGGRVILLEGLVVPIGVNVYP